MTTVSIHMQEQSGQSGLSLYLRKTSDGTLLNTGGDPLTESPASSGRFTATVEETWAETLAAAIVQGGLTVRDGWLAVGETIVRDAYPSSGGGGGGGEGDASQVTLLAVEEKVDAISVALAGGSPVEPTGVTVFEHLEAISSDLNSFATVAARLAVEGQILGFPAAIVRNADYHAAAESEILLTLQDLTGAAITDIAGTPVASVSWLFGMGTERNPNLITGTATWATDRLKIEWLAAATAGKALGTLTWQVGATVGGKTRWLGGGTTRLIERQF